MKYIPIAIVSVLIFWVFVMYVIVANFPLQNYSCRDPKEISVPYEGRFFSCPSDSSEFGYLLEDVELYFVDTARELNIDFEDFVDDPDFTFLDVGANVGLFSFYASKRFTKSKIYSFEPVDENYLKLEKNVEINELENVEVVRSGLSDYEGFLDFSYNIWNPGVTSSGSGRHESDVILCQRKMRTWESRKYLQYFILSLPYAGNVIDYILSTRFNPLLNENMKKTVRGKLTTMSKFIEERDIKHIDFLKVDVEGAEYSVLMGINDDDFKKIRMIAMEVHPFFTEKVEGEPPLGIRIKNLLESKGFRVELINKCAEYGYHDLDIVYQDLVALNLDYER